jgi:hypothetical protein
MINAEHVSQAGTVNTQGSHVKAMVAGVLLAVMLNEYLGAFHQESMELQNSPLNPALSSFGMFDFKLSRQQLFIDGRLSGRIGFIIMENAPRKIRRRGRSNHQLSLYHLGYAR